jgi:hypothetical protein
MGLAYWLSNMQRSQSTAFQQSLRKESTWHVACQHHHLPGRWWLNGYKQSHGHVGTQRWRLTEVWHSMGLHHDKRLWYQNHKESPEKDNVTAFQQS